MPKMDTSTGPDLEPLTPRNRSMDTRTNPPRTPRSSRVWLPAERSRFRFKSIPKIKGRPTRTFDRPSRAECGETNTPVDGEPDSRGCLWSGELASKLDSLEWTVDSDEPRADGAAFTVTIALDMKAIVAIVSKITSVDVKDDRDKNEEAIFICVRLCC